MRRMASRREELEREELEHANKMKLIDDLIFLVGMIAVLTSLWWMQ